MTAKKSPAKKTTARKKTAAKKSPAAKAREKLAANTDADGDPESSTIDPGEPFPEVDDAIEKTEAQPVLPLGLPDYKGTPPTGMQSSISGTGNRILKPHELRERTVLVLEVSCIDSGHKVTDDGIVYHEKLKVLDMFEAHGQPGRNLLNVMKNTYRQADDEANGRAPLEGMGEVGMTDASGVVLTEKEVAALRGDPVRAMFGDDGLVPAVIVYDNGERKLWPDEYPKDTLRPLVGDTEDGTEHSPEVIELLDHATGEPLDVPEPETDDWED